MERSRRSGAACLLPPSPFSDRNGRTTDEQDGGGGDAERGRVPRVRQGGRRGVPGAVRRVRPAVPHGVPRGLRLLPAEAQEQLQPQARRARGRLVLQVLRWPPAGSRCVLRAGREALGMPLALTMSARVALLQRKARDRSRPSSLGATTRTDRCGRDGYTACPVGRARAVS